MMKVIIRANPIRSALFRSLIRRPRQCCNAGNNQDKLLKRAIIKIAMLLATLVCLAFARAPAPGQGDTGDTICFLTVLRLRNSRYADQENLVVNNLDEWRTIWEKINGSEHPPLPEIDFTRRTLICAFQGTQPSTGFEILIQEIAEKDSLIEVTVKTFEPGRGCGVLTMITRPFNIVEIEKTEKQVVFQVKNKIRKCD